MIIRSADKAVHKIRVLKRIARSNSKNKRKRERRFKKLKESCSQNS